MSSHICLDKDGHLGQNVHMSLKEGPSVFERLAPILLVVSIGLAFMVGILWQRVSNLEKGNVSGATVQTGKEDTGKVVPIADIKTIKDLWNKDLIKFGDADKKLLFVENLVF